MSTSVLSGPLGATPRPGWAASGDDIIAVATAATANKRTEPHLHRYRSMVAFFTKSSRPKSR